MTKASQSNEIHCVPISSITIFIVAIIIFICIISLYVKPFFDSLYSKLKRIISVTVLL